MKLSFYLITLFVFLSKPLLAIEKVVIQGMVTDHHTNEPLPGAVIYFPDLKTGCISDSEGNYTIKNLPAAKLTVNVSLNGYKTIIQELDLTIQQRFDFELEETIAELNEIVISGMSKANERRRTPYPISTVSNLELRQSSSMNIIDALAKVPGISQISTGSGISKPVIRGLGFNRVLVINDGIRQEGQQWGAEHGVEIDEFSVNSIEIIKGPASLAYGSDALAGVINMLPSPTLPEGKISGNILLNGQSNNGMLVGSANIGGNKNGFLWDFRFSKKVAHAYKNKYDGYVQNSGFQETDLSGMLGLNKSWGYSHLNFSLYNFTPGIIEGERDSLTGQFLKPVALNDTTVEEQIATEEDFLSYKLYTPYQQINHYKVVSNNNFIIGKGSLKAIIGWQQNLRKEFENPLKIDEYGLFFNTNTINYDFRYVLPEKDNLQVTFGTNGMYQQSRNGGDEFLIPNYDLFDIGGFVLGKKTWKRLDLSGGLRFDLRNQIGQELWLDSNGVQTTDPQDFEQKLFEGFRSVFNGISASVGLSYQINEKMFTKVNVSKGYRAPNIAELASNGVHEGAQNYIIGSNTLNSENSWQADFGLGIQSKHITAELNIFYSYIQNFIYLQKLNSTFGGDSISENVTTLKYQAGTAGLYGGELIFDIHPHPLDWLHMEANFSMVNAEQFKQADSMRYLPFSPAPKIVVDLRADKKKLGKNIRNAYAKVGVESYLTQNRFYSAFGTETATPGYLLINAGLGCDVHSKKRKLFSAYLNVNNLTDVAYQSHLSRLKYVGFNNATGRAGIYNMGRNFSLKVLIPFELKMKELSSK